VRFFRDGKVYDGGVHDIGASAATCGESCTDIGAIKPCLERRRKGAGGCAPNPLVMGNTHTAIQDGQM
jgi:hypothetical protein